MTTHDPYATIAERLGGTLIESSPLKGASVSADVHALKMAMPDGSTERVVVRQHNPDSPKPHHWDSTAAQHALLTTLLDKGMPVPRSLILDTSCEVLLTSYFVTSFVDGPLEVEPDDVPRALETLAGFLANLHSMNLSRLALPGLPTLTNPIPDLLAYVPEGAPFDAVRRMVQAPTFRYEPAEHVLLHGDLWPGNVIWRGGEIVTVLDWEEAALGDPLSDLAKTRFNLMWLYGDDDAQTFTDHYQRLRNLPIDHPSLALWDLRVSAFFLTVMHRWGYPDELINRIRTDSQAWVKGAAGKVVAA